MKKLVKRFMELKGQEVIEQAKKIKKDYPDNNIRIGASGGQGAYTNQTLYYYNPVTDEIAEGPCFVRQNNTTYSYNSLGDIEICDTVQPGNVNYDSLKIQRIIRPEDENKEYADDFEEAKFANYNDMDHYRLEAIRAKYPGATITTCINCGKQYVVNQEDVEAGKYTELIDVQYNAESECICSDCTNNMTVKEFLNTIDDEETKEKYREYMIDYVGMGENWDLFL